jgi:hypothetical protein
LDILRRVSRNGQRAERHRQLATRVAYDAPHMPGSDTPATEAASAGGGKTLGVVLIALAAASLGLLANHPSAPAQTFAELLRNEAADQTLDGVVHGGLIVVVAAQLACLAIVSMRMSRRRAWAVAGLVMASAGAGFLMLSMLLDGLLTPALAALYVDKLDRQNDARPLFALIGMLVRFLMPAGLLFQAASLVCWGGPLVADSGLRRGTGWFGIVAGILVAAAVTMTAGRVTHVLIGALVAIAAWYALLGVTLLRGRLE